MKAMVIEVLYPEFNNLFGDRGNCEYLEMKLKNYGYQVTVINTSLFERPHFCDSQVDFLLIPPCGEKQQLIQLGALSKYKVEIENRIENGGVTLATGNAFELFGDYIEDSKGEKHKCLGLFPYYAKQFSRLRYNDCSVGEFDGMQIVGFKNLLSHAYGENPSPFLTMKKGIGMNKSTKFEGVHKNSFFATYHTGPVLPLNPKFTEYLIRAVDGEYSMSFSEYEMKAYESRLAQLLK